MSEWDLACRSGTRSASGAESMRLLTVPDLLLNIELAYCTGSTSSRSQLTI